MLALLANGASSLKYMYIPSMYIYIHINIYIYIYPRSVSGASDVDVYINWQCKLPGFVLSFVTQI